MMFLPSLLCFATLSGPLGTPPLTTTSASSKAARNKSVVTSGLAAFKPTGYPISPVDLREVTVADSFWAPRLERNAKTTLYHELDECESTGRIENFKAAAGVPGAVYSGAFFNDSDVYKVLEAISYSLEMYPDKKLEAKADAIIDLIANAQEPDGYLHTSREAAIRGQKSPVGKVRWVDEAWDHELYNQGHLYEGAVAYYAATGKSKFLNVAIKSANLVCSVFNAKGNKNVSGHEEIEIGLVKLYRATGNAKYLNEAKWLIDQRGRPEGRTLYGDYAQDDKPVTEQDHAEGHAVRAAYLYTGMADVAAADHVAAYWPALDRFWTDVARSNIYVTGGIGSTGANEGFTTAFDLPNLTAYCETCASVANSLWNQRMFQEEADGRYVDVQERSLYNAFLSGVGQDGKTFFYPNVLLSLRGAAREPWFGCACCPPNDARLLPTIATWIYGKSQSDLYVNLYVQGQVRTHVGKSAVTVTQKSNYPWDGHIDLNVDPAKPSAFGLALRIPGWAQGHPIGSELYTFTDDTPAYTVKVNGEAVSPTLVKGYVTLDRTWKKGDHVELDLPMPAHRVVCDTRVEADRGRVAIQRGPIVYCAEFKDQPDHRVLDLMLPPDAGFTATYQPNLLQGVETLQTTAEVVKRDAVSGKAIATGENRPLTLIPYNAWANRGVGPMEVWLPTQPDRAYPDVAPTIASQAKVTTSAGWGGSDITDQIEARTSDDHNHPYLHWWPRKGTHEWVEFAFKQPAEVSKVKVYWFQDEGTGECRLPAAWRVLVKQAGAWVPVSNPSAYVIQKDDWCEVRFDKVNTDGLRLEIDEPKTWACGIHQVVIQ